MSEYLELHGSHTNSLNTEQRAVLDSNLADVLASETARHYARGLARSAAFYDAFAAKSSDEERAQSFLEVAQSRRRGAATELPFVFGLVRGRDSGAGIMMQKADVNTGERAYDTQILVGHYTDEPLELIPDGTGFTLDDLKLAARCLQKQRRVGLIYGDDGDLSFVDDLQ